MTMQFPTPFIILATLSLTVSAQTVIVRDSQGGKSYVYLGTASATQRLPAPNWTPDYSSNQRQPNPTRPPQNFSGQVPTAPRNAPIAVPEPLTQYVLVTSSNTLCSVPVTSYISPQGYAFVARYWDNTEPLPSSTIIRESFGGIYPYTVVNSQERFVIINQENDILVVGSPDYSPQLVQNYCWSMERSHTLSGPFRVIEVGRQGVCGFVPPPGVFSNIVRLVNPRAFLERAAFEPNTQLAYSTGSITAYDSQNAYRVYRYNQHR